MATYDEYSNTSGNAYNGRTLKRMELEYKDINIKFAINPSDYTQTIPNRATLTQTKGGAWIDAWGAGIVEFTIKGVTGVKGGTKSIDTGYNRWKELEKLFDELYKAVTDGEEVKDLIKFYNHTDNIFYYCYPTQQGIELYRSASKPHLYQYTINLWGIRKIGQPETSSGTIGNPNKGSSSGTATQTSTNKSTTTTTTQAATKSSRRMLMRARAITIEKTIVSTSTKTKTLESIQNDCLEYLTSLEPIIGGKDGKISPVTGYGCTNGLTMQSSGTVSNVNGFSGEDLAEVVNNILLVETKYTSKMSVETYNMAIKMKDYSPEVLSAAYSLIVGTTPKQRVMQAVSKSKIYDSTIYSYIVQYQPKSIISKTEVNQLKIILLESMMVYMELYRLYNDESSTLSTTLTTTNMGILIRNIQAMIMYFTLKSTEASKCQRMNISEELRKLEKIMTQVVTDIIVYL